MATISIITPVYNSEAYIGETIQSIILQKGNFDIEYIVVDGKSTDSTNLIIERYKKSIKEESAFIQCNSVSIIHISEKDTGMYDALSKGLRIATGDIHCYLNASDLFLPGALESVHTAFTNTSFSWIRGNVCYIDEFSAVQKFEKKLIYLNRYIVNGYHGFFNSFTSQETMFWRKDLTKKVGIDINYRYAGDFYLWHNFAKHATLIQLTTYTSCFRIHADQKSGALEKYMQECDTIIQGSKTSYWKFNGLLYKYILKHLFKYKFFYYLISVYYFKPVDYIDLADNVVTVKKSYTTIIP
ncbi:glycosyltransferase [Ferruginibacter paludis]|uniref:glycosyltransferase n=1 Tax=Ferruginibacter paludis TaxID=1310417 RepID=UPI0025B4A78A|nr:glycosyltransferase [Ferruginibacter paludis]MDN3655836.1 glycosyltransferase [Ferruginibacter paludis]